MNGKLAALGGILMVLSAIPHALLGWPPFASELRSAGLSPDLIAGLATGWYFGSAAMVALGLAVLVSARHLSSSRPAYLATLSVGVVYLAFGAAASVARFPKPQPLMFLALGLLITFAAISAQRAVGGRVE